MTIGEVGRKGKKQYGGEHDQREKYQIRIFLMGKRRVIWSVRGYEYLCIIRFYLYYTRTMDLLEELRSFLFFF